MGKDLITWVKDMLKRIQTVCPTLNNWPVRMFYVPCEPLTGIAFESCTQELYLGVGVFNT